jgi:hypothetical protein
MNLGTRMLAGVAIGVTLLIAAPGGARAQEERRGGCREAGQFIASMAHDERGLGEFSSALAELGLRDEVARGLHSTLCDLQP